MSRFGNLDSREPSRGEHILLAQLPYMDSVQGLITAEREFETNYASIQVLLFLGLFMLYGLLVGYGDKACTIHDWLYSGYPILKSDGTRYWPTRKEADQVLYRALRAEGVDRFRSWIFYAGVRIGAASHFSKIQNVWSAPSTVDL